MVDKKTGLKPKAEKADPKKVQPNKAAETEVETKAAVEEAAEPITEEAAEPKVTKAGKHSAKAQRQTEAKEAKKERKASGPQGQPKKSVKPPRTKLERAGKKYRQASQQIDKTKSYSLSEAVELALKTSPTQFDATVELHIRLNVDPKQADQNVRGMVTLPGGSAKQLKIAVFAEAEDAAKAKAAGADIAGTDELLALFDKGQLNFDVLIAPPALMAQLGKYAKILGPRGLMPNPKSGTVSSDVTKAVKEAKSGRIEFRVDQAGIIHLSLGKISFGQPKLLQNAEAVIGSVQAAKPASVKGVYVNSVFLTTTMGPSIRVTL